MISLVIRSKLVSLIFGEFTLFLDKTYLDSELVLEV